MERIDVFNAHLVRHFDNQTGCHDFIKLYNGASKLHEFISISTLSILLGALIHIRGDRKIKIIFFRHIKKNFVINPICYLLTLLVLPLLILIMLLFVLMKLVVQIILKLKYKDLFGGFLESADAVWAIEDVSKTIINVVVTIHLNKPVDAIELIKNSVFKKIFKEPHRFPKLTSIRMRSMGFNFLLKNQVTVDDCVSALKWEKEHERLSGLKPQEIVSEYSNRPLPKQNSALWEILVFSKHIQCQSKENDECSVTVLLRFSHTVGDGLSLTNFLLRTFADDGIEDISKSSIYNSQNYSSFLKKDKFASQLTNVVAVIKSILEFIRISLMAPSIIIQANFLRKGDVNGLHGCQLSGHKILVCAIEKEKECISLVKKIKTAVPNSRFSDILLMAISGSLDKYFRNKSQFSPDFATAAVPALLCPPNMDEKPILQNQFSIALLDLPILIKSNSVLQRLQEVIKYTNKLRKSPDYKVNYWLLRYFCGVIPHPVLRYSLKSDKLTMTISNVPGLPKLSILNGCNVIDIVFYTPHRGTTGVGFTILTYDDRFQLGLKVDKSIISSVDEAQLIVNDIFAHIHLLGEELFP